jgi:hypothetical protein
MTSSRTTAASVALPKLLFGSRPGLAGPLFHANFTIPCGQALLTPAPELDFVIARAVAKDPAQRYQRGLEFALDLRELRERRQTISKGSNRASRFPGAREVLDRSLGDATTHVS